MRKYNQIAEDPKPTEELLKKRQEIVEVEEFSEEPSEETDAPEAAEEDSNSANKIESLAYDFIAGKFGPDIDTAQERINETGADGGEVISVAMRILNGTYYE